MTSKPLPDTRRHNPLLKEYRLTEAKLKRDNLKCCLYFTSNCYMIKYYTRFIHRLELLILRNTF